MVQPSMVVIDGFRDLTVYSPTSFPPFPSRLLPVFLLFPLPLPFFTFFLLLPHLPFLPPLIPPPLLSQADVNGLKWVRYMGPSSASLEAPKDDPVLNSYAKLVNEG